MESIKLPKSRFRGWYTHWYHISNKIKVNASCRHNYISKSKDSHRLSMGIQQWIITHRTATCDHSSDHNPVETILNLQPCLYGPEAQQSYNYKNMDWKTFKQKLQNYLPNLNHLETPTAETVNKLANDISTSIQRATQETTSQVDICQFSKRWWNKDLAELWKQAQWTQWRFKKYERQEDEDLWKEQWQIFHWKMNECKWETWQKFITKADKRSIWKSQ